MADRGGLYRGLYTGSAIPLPSSLVAGALTTVCDPCQSDPRGALIAIVSSRDNDRQMWSKHTIRHGYPGSTTSQTGSCAGRNRNAVAMRPSN